jgi:hypothetical protein
LLNFKISKFVFLPVFAVFVGMISSDAYSAKGHGGSGSAEGTAPKPDVFKDNGMYFSCKDDKVIVRNCAGQEAASEGGCKFKTEADRKQNEKVIEKSQFLAELFDEVKILNQESLKPLTSEQVKNADRKNEISAEETRVKLDMARQEAEEVLAFLDAIYLNKETAKQDDAYVAFQKKISDLVKKIKNKDADFNAINRDIDAINKELKDNVLGKVCDKDVVYKLSEERNKGQLIHEVLKKYDPKPVTKKETLADGMLELEKREFGTGPNNTNRDFWKDVSVNTRTGKPNNLIWGPRATTGGKDNDGLMTYDQAMAYCDSLREPSFPGVKWRLPTKDDFLDALGNSAEEKEKGWDNQGQNFVLLNQLPEMKGRWYRSSSVYSSDRAWVFYGSNGGVDHNYRVYRNRVRCVS